MKRSSLQTLVGCVLSLSLGAALAGFRSQPRTEISPDRAQPEQSKVALQQPTAGQVQLPEPDEVLVQAMKTEKGAKRWLVMFSAVEKATAFDMPALIRAAGDDPAMSRMLAARWAELDPRGMFHWVSTDYLLPEGSPNALPNRWILADVLFEEWTKRDLNGAIKAVTDVPNYPGRDSLRMSVSNTILKADVEQGLRVMKEWNINNYIPDMRKVGEWAARDPRHAAEVVMQLGGNIAGQEALKQVGKTWGTSSPAAGLEFAATLDPAARATLGTEIMRAWAEKDIKAAAASAAAQPDPSFRGALAQGLVSTWGKSDPAAALAWSQENLRGTARTEAISDLVKAAAEKDLRTASELVSEMEPGAAQNRACASIFETWFNKGEGQRTAAFEWLASLPDAEAQHAALERVQWNWMWKEPDAARDFVTGPYGGIASRSMVSQVARSQTSKDPEAAMQWASKLPGERAEAARQAVLDQWLSIRPEGAMEYARTLPSGPAREQAIRTVSQTLAYQSPQQLGTWYGKLPGSDQKIIREIIDQTRFPDAQMQQLKKALNLP